MWAYYCRVKGILVRTYKSIAVYTIVYRKKMSIGAWASTPHPAGSGTYIIKSQEKED